MRRRLLLLAGALAFLSGAWFFFGRPTLEQGQVIVGQTVYRVEIPQDSVSQHQGLRGRTKVPEGTGMYFVFAGTPTPKTFTMDGVLVPLDLLWIRDGRIIGISAQVPPAGRAAGTRYDSPSAVDTVLEFAGGTAAKASISIGDTVRLMSR